MKTEGTGKHPVAKGNLHHIVVCHTGGGHEAGNKIGPGLDIVLGVTDNSRLPCGA